MRRLKKSVTVSAPSGFAFAHIGTYFLEQGSQGSAQLALRFPLPNLVIGGLTLEKAVSLKFAHGAVNAGSQSMAIGWEPVETRALPAFSGTLSAVAQGEHGCRLTIDGGYQPPGGIFGAIFDALIGVRIARATLAAFIERLAHGIEADYSVRMTR